MVVAAAAEQLLVRAALLDTTPVDDEDAVGAAGWC
jgi:hypothetical protein